MKALTLFLTCFFVIVLDARTVGYSSSITGGRFVRVMNESIEKGLIDMQGFSSWSDIEVLPTEAQSEALNGLSDLPNLSDYYYIIPQKSRFETDAGIAYFALAEPLSYNQLEAELHAKEEGKTLEELPEVDRSDEFRWIIYLQDDGFLTKEQMSEDAFQELITKNGVNIGKPERYRFNMDRLMSEMGRPQNPEPLSQVVEEVTQPELENEESAEVVVTEPTEEPAEQSSNWWLWLIGLLVVVGSIGLVVRRKS